MRGIDRGTSDPGSLENPLGLANVYIDLNTTTPKSKKGENVDGLKTSRIGREEGETAPLSALEAAARNERMALVGDPGGGKTTFVRHLVHCLADPEKRSNLIQWPDGASALLPILVILRDFVHSLPDPVPGKAEPRHLWSFIVLRGGSYYVSRTRVRCADRRRDNPYTRNNRLGFRVFVSPISSTPGL